MEKPLLKILELTGFQGDREKWLSEAFGILNMNTFSSLVLSLSDEKQKEFQEKLKGEDPIQKVPRMLSEYFSQDQIESEYERQSEIFISKYLENIFPDLTDEQKTAVENFFNSQNTKSA